MSEFAKWMPVALASYVLWQASITTNRGGNLSLIAIKLVPAALSVATIVAFFLSAQ